jgi:hypothetical protein
MTKEAKSNFIVLAVIVAIMLPGAVILFRKKLEPTARRMYMPDPVISSTAWCDPIPPEGLKRIVPAKSAAWFAGEARRAYGVVEPAGWAGDRPDPVMSTGRWVQMISVEGDLVRVAIWDERATGANLTAAGGEVVRSEAVPMPKDVRHDLQDVGFVLPPERVLFAEVRMLAGAKELKLTWRKAGESAGWSGGEDVLLVR